MRWVSGTEKGPSNENSDKFRGDQNRSTCTKKKKKHGVCVYRKEARKEGEESPESLTGAKAFLIGDCFSPRTDPTCSACRDSPALCTRSRAATLCREDLCL